MSKLDSMRKVVGSLAEQERARTIMPDYVLGQELQAEFRLLFGLEIALETDTTLTPEERTARMQAIERDLAASKTPERLEQERRFYRKYNAAGAKEILLQRLARLCEEESRTNTE